jgi:hypothetical protein
MNTSIESQDQDTRPKIDEQRRRLTKGGLAAPIVIGTLLSRPVLGDAPHHCTISGQVSGNMSTHDQSTLCSSLGSSPSVWANSSPSSWPGSLTNSGTPLLFNLAPSSTNPKFADVYTKGGADATVLEVLKGEVTVKPGSAATVELGKEAVAAYLNAADQTKYPITQQEVVAMFNTVVVTGGMYVYSSSVSMNATQVLTFFQSLHT